MQSRSLKSILKKQRGGVVMEFSVISPILLLVCFGMFDIGQAFSQKAWLESVAYQSVMMGGELQELRVESMKNVSNELVDVLHTRLEKKFVTPNGTAEATEDTTQRTVTSVIPGEMRMVSNIVRIPYRVTLTGPILTRAGDITRELDPFAENDGTTRYDCSGNRITGIIVGPVGACECVGTGQGSPANGCF